MSRTIIEIATEAAERNNTAPAPSTLFGTNEGTAKILRNAATDTMRDILRQTNWRGISEFHSQWAFPTIANKHAYALPPDFLRIIPDTETRGGWPLGLIGPASPQSWAYWIVGVGATTAPMGWRIKNNVLMLEPTPTSAELLVIEYISRYPVVADVTDDDLDLSAQPVRAVSPFVLRSGYIAEGTDDVVPAGTFFYGAPPGFDTGVWNEDVWEYLKHLNPLSAVAPLAQIRKPAFTADTDLPAFADDYLLSIGMTFRLRRALGLPYEEEAAEYEQEMEMKLATDAGGGRDFGFGREHDTYGALPLGGGNWMVS